MIAPMPEPRGDPTMPFLDHLRELRRRLIVSLAAVAAAAVAAYVFFDPIVAFLFRPFRGIEALASQEQLLFVTSLFEGFLVRLKAALLAGVVFSLPVHVYNLVRFVFPGLTVRERKVVLWALGVSFGLTVVSFYYGYFQVIPVSLRFLSGSGFVPRNVGLLLSYHRNVFLIFQFLLVTLIVFQLPVLLEVLMIMGVVSRRRLLRSSRYVVVGIFVLAAVVTPPDFVSQLSLALPLVALYFLSILVARIFHFGKR